MMRAPRFRYHRARDLGDAAAVLAGEGPSAMPLAGGTDLVPNLKRRQQVPRVIVGLRGIAELRQIDRGSAGSVSIGACVTLTRITAEPWLRTRSALVRAAAQVATPLLRNMGTVGGNLCLDTRCNYYNQNYEWRQAIDFCMKAPVGTAVRNPSGGVCWVAPGSPRCWAVSSSDTAPALIALGARVRLVSTAGAREIPLDELYADDGMDYLTKRPEELLTAVLLPPLQPGCLSTYWKLRRRGSFDFPVLSVAAAIDRAPDGVVTGARVVLGGVGSRPVVVDEAAKLVGGSLGDEAIVSFADRAARLAKPLDNTDFALGWRKRVAREYLIGALRELRGDDPQTLGQLARHASGHLPVLS
jgi:4-hydroxybenzoyl-CoA reductase subunit beta